MIPKNLDEDAQAETLQELMDAMGKMDGRRAAPNAPGFTIEISGGAKGGTDSDDPSPEASLGGEEGLEGMDPRLVEIIRRKRGG